MPAVHCPICFNDFLIGAGKPEIITFPCGHGFCKNCTDRLFQGHVDRGFLDARPKCPHCRVTLNRPEGHPIYLELVNSVSQNSGKLLKGRRPGDDVVTVPLRSIQDFQDRAVNLCEAQEREIDALRNDLDESNKMRDYYHEEAKKVESLQAEIDRLGLALDESEHNISLANRLARIAKGNLEIVQKRAVDLDQQNRHFKDQLETHVKTARLQKVKFAKQLVSMAEQFAEREPESAFSTMPKLGAKPDSYELEHTSNQSVFPILTSASRSPGSSLDDTAILPVFAEAHSNCDTQTLGPCQFSEQPPAEVNFNAFLSELRGRKKKNGRAVRG